MNTNEWINEWLIGGCDNRYRGDIYEGYEVLSRVQSCKSIVWPLVVGEGPPVFVFIRVHSWFAFMDDHLFFLE